MKQTKNEDEIFINSKKYDFSEYADLIPLQMELKDILTDFSALCGELNLHFYLMFGTLLGAARHRDIIPWDDDIDVGMLRSDYDRLIDYFSRYKGDDYELDCVEASLKCVNLFSKFIRKKNNEGFEYAFSHPNGLSIDIFPIDYYTDDVKRRIAAMIINILRAAASSKEQLKNKSFKENRRKSIVRRIFVIPFFPFRSSNLIKLASSLCKKNYRRETELVSYGGIYELKRKVWKKEDWLGEQYYLQFGDKKYQVPSDYKSVLSTIYGSDYMSIPPVNLRVQHKKRYYPGEA